MSEEFRPAPNPDKLIKDPAKAEVMAYGKGGNLKNFDGDGFVNEFSSSKFSADQAAKLRAQALETGEANPRDVNGLTAEEYQRAAEYDQDISGIMYDKGIDVTEIKRRPMTRSEQRAHFDAMDQLEAEKAAAETEPSEDTTPQSEVVLPLSDEERAESAEERDEDIAEARERVGQIINGKTSDQAPTQRFLDHQAETQARLAQGRLERSNKQRAEQGLKPRVA